MMYQRGNDTTTPQPPASRRDRPAVALEYFVSLDLGSESMAASFQHRNGLRPVIINLQAMAGRLRPQAAGMDPVDLLRDDDQQTISPRLRTRVSLRERKQPSPLPDDHAILSLEKGSGDSIFEFFHFEGEALGSERLIPNPKLLFQTGIRAVIPRIEGPNGKVQYEPAEILQHMTVQILNNFVLNAKELQDDALSRGYAAFDRSKAHLTITVPNVYSLTHVRRLESFIRRHVGVGDVQTMYESDAIAHFMIGKLPDDPLEVKEMKNRIGRALEQSKGADVGNCLVLTIDVGKGTTDLSLFNYDFNHKAKTFTHDVLGRTGRSHGGARLSFILADHLNSQICHVLKVFEGDSRTDALLRKAIVERRPYVSLLSQPDRAAGRGSILGAAEKLIEAVKRRIDERYRIEIAPLEDLIKKLADILVQEIAGASAIGPLLAGAQTPEVAHMEQQMKSLRDALIASLRFPEVLPGGSGAFSTLHRVLARFLRKQQTTDGPFFRLRERLERYVQQNVEEPLAWLVEMAEAREQPARRRRQLFTDSQDRVFVVVAGQASRFEPIRRAIRDKVRETLNISTDSGGNLLFMPSALAKMSCCFGSQWYYRAALHCSNPEEIMGTYAFARQAAPFGLVNLDMRIFNQKNEQQPVNLANGDYWLIFQPRHLPKGHMSSENLDPDTVAYIRTFSFSQGGQIEVCYRGWGNSIELTEGDVVSEVEYEATFGDVGEEVEEIYVKTWPEAVRHES
jgi:hypothetical protein